MLPSEFPRLATDLPVRAFPGVWELLSFLRLPSQDGSLSLPLLSLFLSFVFFPTSFRRQWAAFLGAWCPLPAFRSCFMEFTQRSKCSFDEFVGEKVVSLSCLSAILGLPLFLLCSMLSRFVIAFLPRSKCLLISWLQSLSAVILEPPPNSLWLFPLFPHLFVCGIHPCYCIYMPYNIIILLCCHFLAIYISWYLIRPS